MKKILPLFSILSLLILLSSCATTEKLTGNGPLELKKVSTDNTYGYSQENPIKVGGVVDSSGPDNEHTYLQNLAGPGGEKITYTRTGSCCAFDSERGFLGKGLLDIYVVSYEGIDKPVTLYLNMYDYQQVYAPVGFTIR